MRILFTTLPVQTHLRPLVAVAYAAQRRGHEVAVCAPASFREEVEHYGLRFLPAGRDWITGMLAPLMDARTIPPQELTLLMNRLVTQGIPGKDALVMAEDVLERAREFAPDIVVREAYELGGYLAAEVLHIPHASIGVVGRVTEFLDLALLAPPLGEQRQALGLPPDPDGERVYAYLHAHFMPPHYDPAESTIPTLRCYRHHTVDQPMDRLPDFLTELDPARPLVYASLGTVAPLFRAADSNLAVIIEGLGEVDCEAVVTVGADNDPEAFGTVPDNVRVVDTIAQPLLLDSVDLLVTHAGFTSVREAMRAGVPMVAIPWIAENHLIARRCAELGLAVALEWETLDAARVARACRTVLGDPGHRARARSMQRAMLTLPPMESLVADLERLAAEGAHR